MSVSLSGEAKRTEAVWTTICGLIQSESDQIRVWIYVQMSGVDCQFVHMNYKFVFLLYILIFSPLRDESVWFIRWENSKNTHSTSLNCHFQIFCLTNSPKSKLFSLSWEKCKESSFQFYISETGTRYFLAFFFKNFIDYLIIKIAAD